jgi:uncharacterized protein YbdZ (MbtH family)
LKQFSLFEPRVLKIPGQGWKNVDRNKERNICLPHHWTNWTNEKRNPVRFLERIFSQLAKMRTKRLLRRWKGVLFDRPIVLRFALPLPAPPRWFDRSSKSLSLPDRQLQQAKFICKSWSLLVSELQLTAPANAGVQKAESVCKPWRLSVSELHTYFVEKRYIKSVADRIVKDLLRLPCPSGRNRLPRKFPCEGDHSNTVFERGKSVALTVPALSGRNSLPRKLICLSGRSEPPLFKSSFCNPIRQHQSLKTIR